MSILTLSLTLWRIKMFLSWFLSNLLRLIPPCSFLFTLLDDLDCHSQSKGCKKQKTSVSIISWSSQLNNEIINIDSLWSELFRWLWISFVAKGMQKANNFCVYYLTKFPVEFLEILNFVETFWIDLVLVTFKGERRALYLCGFEK